MLAEYTARRGHAGQTEESTGDDYVHHLERVVALVDGNVAKTVAWLHDLLEDTTYTAHDLVNLGFDQTVVASVIRLTRVPERTTYAQYIAQLKASGDPVALAVKLADLRDHLRPNCPARLRPRYEAALAVLTAP